MGWRTLYIEDSHKVSLYLNNLKIESGDEQYVVPIADIDTIIFNNYKMYMTVQLLCKLSQNNVCVIICEKNGLPEIMLNPITGNCTAFRQQELQLNLSDERKAILWQQLIEAKISNQLDVLSACVPKSDNIKHLTKFVEEVQPADSTNREGLAAKTYFRGLYGNDFLREHESTDPINIALNYGYAVLRAMLARSIAAKGLLPTIGIKHRNLYKHFNLTDDFIEPYRPIVDQWVYHNICQTQDIFARDRRISLLETLSGKIYLEGKKYGIAQSMNIYVDSIIRYMETGETAVLKMPFPHVIDDE